MLCTTSPKRLTMVLMKKTITIRLPQELLEWLEAESDTTGRPKSSIIREQLERARTQKKRQPFLDLAGAVDGTPDLSQKRGFEA